MTAAKCRPPGPTPGAPADARSGRSIRLPLRPPGAGYHPAYGPARSLTLNVKVPADAKVFVNGMATTSTGTDRQYISKGLKAGSRYSYEVRAEFAVDGQTVTQTKNVQLGAGENGSLSFDGQNDAEQTADAAVKTKLTVHVPADAKLFLSGRETRSTGEVREFVTKQLAAGQEWSTYTVRAVAEVNGQQVVKDQTITLKAGEARELNFDFNNSVAAAADVVAR